MTLTGYLVTALGVLFFILAFWLILVPIWDPSTRAVATAISLVLGYTLSRLAEKVR